MPRPPADPDEYALKKARDNARARKLSEDVRDISPLPAVAAPVCRERCRISLWEHCLIYHPAKFFLPFSPDHLVVIDLLERAIRDAVPDPAIASEAESERRAPRPRQNYVES